MPPETEIVPLGQEESTLSEMVSIGRQCFGDWYTEDFLKGDWLLGDPRSIFYGVRSQGELVAFNGFLAHGATSRRGALLLYQSCHSATRPDHRGRGLFQALIEHAKHNLDGDFIVGFPNANSEPIFLKRLGFRRLPLSRIWLPTVLSSLLLDDDRYRERFADVARVRLDERACARWKSAERPDEVIVIEDGSALLWGRIVLRKLAGLQSRTFVVGGFDAKEPRELSRLLSRLAWKWKVPFAQFIYTVDSALAAAARLPLSGDRTEPAIWCPLRPPSDEPRFDFGVGLKDAW